MKVYLDDERETPEGWVRCYWPDEVIDLLHSGEVTEISLDHDLGDDERGTGYDVILWIEEAVSMKMWTAPKISIHTANISARAKMEAGIRQIEKLMEERSDYSNHKKRGNFLTSWGKPAWYLPETDEPVRLEDSDRVLFFNLFEFGEGMVLGVEGRWKYYAPSFLADGRHRPLVPQPMAIWETQSGKRINFLRGHHFGDVRGVELLEDGRLITWGRDYLIRVWDLSTGMCSDVLPLPLWPHPADRRAVLSCAMFARMKPSEKLRFINDQHLPSPNVRIDWITKPGGAQHSFQCASRSEKMQNIVKPCVIKIDEHPSERIWDVMDSEAGYSDWFITSDARLCGGGTTYGATGLFYVWDGFCDLQFLIVGDHDCNTYLKGEIAPKTVRVENFGGLVSNDQYHFQI